MLYYKSGRTVFFQKGAAMKYFGEKSLSSWLNGFLKVARWVVLIGAIAVSVAGGMFITFISVGAKQTLSGTTGASKVSAAACEKSVTEDHIVNNHAATGIGRLYEKFHTGLNEKERSDFDKFNRLPLIVKILMFPYFWVIVVFLLKLIRRSQQLFKNFSNSVLFNRSNVDLLTTISKLNIVVSILTFSFSSLLASLFLFMVCEIFKNGTMLQEEHDLTV
jgi:hypothetical protein